MDQVLRFDKGSLKIRKTTQGYIRADGQITRSGVLKYRNADGSLRLEYRPPDEVFDAASLETLALAPVTFEHPRVDGRHVLLDSANTRDFARGTLGEQVIAEAPWVKAQLQITDSELMAAAQGGMVGLSPGYHCDWDPTPGVTPEGERYDGVQRNIRYNHVAILDKGRAGGTLEHFDGEEIDSETQPTKPKDKLVRKIKLDGLTFEVDDQLADALAAEQAAADSLLQETITANDKLKARADHAEAELTKAKERMDAASDPAEVQKRVAARLDLERRARQLFDGAEDLSGKSDADIHRAAIEKFSPGAKLDGASDEYLAARFDQVMDSLGDKSLDQLRQTVDAANESGNPVERARQALAKRNADRAVRSMEAK